ncbi:MAG TPA: sulfate ABC transporter substrate-binding protein [Solirubrobacteraceae bacterium]|nr:sulfate ABC transporter substrate-binding protein [Solirubrobacteraceae bacterium]
MTRRPAAALALLLAAAALLTACGSSSSSGSKQVALVAYSTPQAAYEKLIRAYDATSAGKEATFSQSYGPSGEQSRAVANGLHADLVNFSLEPDVERLVKSGQVQPSWNQTPTKGMVTNSVDVIIVRKGNPKHIKSWADLIKPGVQVLTPNPFTSGAARWNVVGAYGAQLKEGKSKAQALEYVKALFHNVVSQDSSARNALQTFLAGRGDALLDYETEAIQDEKKGAPIEYIIPENTIQIENPLAVVGSSEGAKKFAEYLVTPAAQQIWVENGYRPVISGVPGASSFKNPPGLFTIQYLGGWKKIQKEFFEKETGLVTKIEESLGVSTSK